MNYLETLEFLYSQLPAYHRIGKPAYKDNLSNSIALDDHFNHPHTAYSTIHIAGTNGKGSLSHMIASVLQEAGFKTGLYTSPHLKDFRERIKVDGIMVSEKFVTEFVRENMDIIKDISPSFFEMTVAMAFNYFAETDVDIAVIETGMGGRLDSTNIITPVVSVITNIGHDHMDFLGQTLDKIAYEKAGIIKDYIPVIIGESITETGKVFSEKATDKRSEIFYAEENYLCAMEGYSDGYSSRNFKIDDLRSGNSLSGKTHLSGDYQARNIQTLFQTMELLKFRFNISEKNLMDGIERTIKNTGLMGRWQVLNRKPLTICDTAHNEEGLRIVLQQISKIRSSGLHIIVGLVNDKDIGSILPLFPTDAIYYFTRASVPRALDEQILRQHAVEHNLTGKCYSSVREAYEAARQAAGMSDLIFIGGSTFIVAEVV